MRRQPLYDRAARTGGRPPHQSQTFHFTPTSCSWLNAVEGFFSKITRQAIRRGVFRSVDDLIATIDRYIQSANQDPKPFV